MMYRSLATQVAISSLDGQAPAADLGRWMAEISHALHVLDARLDDLRALATTVEDGGEVVAVDGVFEGDAAAALQTARLWLQHARARLRWTSEAIDGAHIAVGGLADRPPGDTP